MSYDLLSPYQTPQTLLTIGLYLRRLRKEGGYSQKSLAQKTGLLPSTLSKLENGRLRLTKKHLQKLEKALFFDPVDVEDLSRILALQYMNEISRQILGTYPE